MTPAGATVPRLWMLLLAACGAAAVLLATVRYGPGLTPDSANYFSAAASLSSGQGLLSVAGEPLVHFPPALPAILAVLGFIGLEPSEAARLLNALCLALVSGATVLIVARLTASVAAAFVAGGFVVMSAPLVDAFTYALSEAPFVALLACSVLLLPRLADEGHVGVVALGVVAAFVLLTRYVGIVIVPAVAVVILSISPGSTLRRCARAGVFCALASMPLTAWLARNAWLTGTLMGERAGAAASPVSVLRSFAASMADWLVPWGWMMALRAYSDAPWALLLVFVGATAATALLARPIRLWWIAGARDPVARGIVGFLVLWIVGYSALLCSAAMLVSFDPIEPRFLVPLVFPSVVLVAMAVTAAAAARAESGAGSTWFRTVLVCIIVLVGGLQLARSALLIAHKRAEGAGGYATTEWQQSPLLLFLGVAPLPADAVTNGADVLFLFRGERHRWIPRASDAAGIDAMAESLRRGEEVTVVWLDAIDWRPYLVSRESLLALGEFETIHSAADGALYASRPR